MNIQNRTTATDILRDIGLEELNSGACAGPAGWAPLNASSSFPTINPSTEEIIARISAATEADYDRIIATAHDAFLKWRMVPAPSAASWSGVSANS